MVQSLPGFSYGVYALALAGLWGLFALVRTVRERAADHRRDKAALHGVAEPPSLHPIINPELCIGCGACTHACPEGRIIGMVAGKAQLLDPASCIGHGACKTACPVAAIDLVFGSERRGVDIPLLSPTFESNVPGLYIAGELGGMGLIANAIEQGTQAMDAIARRKDLGDDPAQPGIYDVIIVGGGPAGIAASLTAKQKRLRFLTVEQDTLGGTVARYPRAKLVMTRPAVLPLFGRVKARRIRKERLLALWQSVLHKTQLKIHEGVRVERLARTDWGFEVATTAGTVRASAVLLATGRRGSPRRLGVPGDNASKVVYSLDQPTQYNGQHVLVVGGGDSALEAAIELGRYPLASLTLVHRGSAFERAKPVNRERLERLMRAGRVRARLAATVHSIASDRVTLLEASGSTVIRNDAVIVCVGGVLPMHLLSDVGVHVEAKFGTTATPRTAQLAPTRRT
jgi:thioredoxin reductase (NADPH)